jgi:hypothetical protein
MDIDTTLRSPTYNSLRKSLCESFLFKALQQCPTYIVFFKVRFNPNIGNHGSKNSRYERG